MRGNRQFCEGEMHYWEVKMSSTVYGTDMVHVIISIPKEMGVIHNFDNQFRYVGDLKFQKKNFPTLSTFTKTSFNLKHPIRKPNFKRSYL